MIEQTEIKDKAGNVTSRGYYIGKKKVVFLGARGINEAVEWDKPGNIVGKPIKLESLPDSCTCVPVKYVDFQKQTKDGYVIRTPEEVQLWIVNEGT